MGAPRYEFDLPREFPWFFVPRRRVLVYDDRVELCCNGRTERSFGYEDGAKLSYESGAILFLGPEERSMPRKIRLSIPCRKVRHYEAVRKYYDAFWKENVQATLGKVSWTQDLAEKLKDLRALKKQYDRGEITREEYAQLRQGLLVGL